jgi:sortase A
MDKETFMTRYERKRKNARQRRKMIFSLSLIAVGLVLVITAVVLEASHYPWGLLFGTANQDADSITDPPPIVLDAEDQGAAVIFEVPSMEPVPAETAETPPDEASPPAETALPGNPEDSSNAPPVTKYVVLGTLKIPVLGVSQNLLEGAGKQMKYGVGHIPSTAAPGQKGNCAISGHRPYPFRYLDQLNSDDHIVIKYGGISYTYAVFDKFDVLPTDVWVLNSIPGEDYVLTLITCTPYMVSSHRLIVRARLIDIDGKTPQEYYGDISPEAGESPDAFPEQVSPSVESPDLSETSLPPEETADPSDVPVETQPEPDSTESENL